MREITEMILVCLVVASCLISSPAQTDATQDSLWQKALVIAEENENWVPGLVIVRMEELGKDGEAKSVEETWMRLRLGQDGELVHDTVKILRDGEDVTDEPREWGKSGSTSAKANPFNPEVQNDVSVNREEQEELVMKKECIPYEFVQKTEDGEVLSGTAWLEKETGTPVQIQFETDPMPKHTRSMLTTTDYEFTSEGFWYPRETVIKASAGFLWIKKSFRVTVSFSEYWRKPKE